MQSGNDMVMEEGLARSNLAGFEDGEQGPQTGTQKASRSWKQPGNGFSSVASCREQSPDGTLILAQ